MIAKEVEKLEQENIALKEQLERLRGLCGETSQLPKKCEYCSEFVQHYIRQGNVYVPAYAGHCRAGYKIRKRNIDETCGAFREKNYGKNII